MSDHQDVGTRMSLVRRCRYRDEGVGQARAGHANRRALAVEVTQLPARGPVRRYQIPTPADVYANDRRLGIDRLSQVLEDAFESDDVAVAMALVAIGVVLPPVDEDQDDRRARQRGGTLDHRDRFGQLAAIPGLTHVVEFEEREARLVNRRASGIDDVGLSAVWCERDDRLQR